MQKLLSIIIPTYNMEQLLPRCLDSLLTCEQHDSLDILVVNDGSRDNSLAVAQSYAERYSGIVSVIDKPNGNYGSTINAALPQAHGKYVKILDSDDFFDTKSLENFIQKLATTDADLVVTHFTCLGPNKTREVVKYHTMGREVYEYDHLYDADDVLSQGHIRFFLMHAITYRTTLLQQMGYHQTEGISYTDTQWACYPIFFVKTLVFFNINLYQYNLDREGQTMSPAVMQKSVGQLEKVTDEMVIFYENNIQNPSISSAKKAFLKQYYENRIRILYKILLLDIPRQGFSTETMLRIDEKYTKICEQNDFHFVLYPENKLLRIDYIRYWHKHHHRWPMWLEKVNALVDKVVVWTYRTIFRR